MVEDIATKNDTRKSFARHFCICGNPVSHTDEQCGQCFGELYLESDGQSGWSGRNDDSGEWVARLEDGNELLSLAYDDTGDD